MKSQSRYGLSLQICFEPSHGLAPGVAGRFGPVAGPGVAIEAMSATRVDMELMVLVKSGQFGVDFRYVVR